MPATPISLATPEAARICSRRPPEELLGTNVNAAHQRQPHVRGGSRAGRFDDGPPSTWTACPSRPRSRSIFGGEQRTSRASSSRSRRRSAPTLGASRGKAGRRGRHHVQGHPRARATQINEGEEALASRFARSTREHPSRRARAARARSCSPRPSTTRHARAAPSCRSTARPFPPRLIESELFGYESGSFTGAEKRRQARQDRACRGRHAFLGRNRRHAPRTPGHAAARPGEQARHPRRRENVQADRFPPDSRNEPEPSEARERAPVPRRPALPHIGAHRQSAPAARPNRRRALLRAVLPQRMPDQKPDNGRVTLSDEAAHFVSVYAWPGNVRQLKHAIYSAYYTCENGVINIDDFPLLHRAEPQSPRTQREHLGAAAPADVAGALDRKMNRLLLSRYRTAALAASNTASRSRCRVAQDSPLPTLSLSELERIAINEAIRQADGNIAAAAAILDISKATLYRKLKESSVAVLRRTAALLRAAGPGPERPIGLETMRQAPSPAR